MWLSIMYKVAHSPLLRGSHSVGFSYFCLTHEQRDEIGFV